MVVSEAWHVKWEFLGILAGLFLIIEGLLSIIKSKDQRGWSHGGRVVRILMGIIMVFIDYTALKSW